MTDIRRHLPAILTCLRQHLASTHNNTYQELCSDLRALLPTSYHIGSGHLINTQGQISSHIDIIICDRTIAGSPVQDGYYDIRQALATLMVNTAIDLDTAISAIASVKALRPAPTPAHLRPATNNTQQPARIPKQLLPLGIIGCQRLIAENQHIQSATPETLSLVIDAALQHHPVALRPDYVLLHEQGLMYRHPLFDNKAFVSTTINIAREPELQRPQLCYGCQEKYIRRHFFYERLCLSCGDLNYKKRISSSDLSGRVALVTGGRVKIGYATALRLLRNGAQVIVTTRFPHDAARRYSNEPDFALWHNRLTIYGLDFRYLPTLEHFIAHLYRAYPSLDIVINNAAQTVRRPLASYAHLLPSEEAPLTTLPMEQQLLVQMSHQVLPTPVLPLQEEKLLSPTPFIPARHEKQLQTSITEPSLDTELQEQNSWYLRIDEIGLTEFLEVQVINVTAPFLLVSRLASLMRQSAFSQRFIVNVSAAEGRFTQVKIGTHAHTNMAKAALNMLTHTAANDLARDGILMNSVDPGWVSPQELAPEFVPDENKSTLPLDMLDAAARVCDPVFTGIDTAEAVYGKFYRHYEPTDW